MRSLLSAICLNLALGGVAQPSLAQSPAPAAQPAPPPAATDGFVPVTDLPPDETLPAAPLVIGAYSFIWLVVLGYVGLLARRIRAVQKDIDALRRQPNP